MQRGQVTIFIIIALVIIAGIIVYILFRDQINERILPIQNPALSREAEQVKQNVEECLMNVTIEAVSFVASQGGYYDLSGISSVRFYPNNVPYYWDIGNSIVPSEDFLKESLSKYILNNSERCFDTLDYERENILVQFGNEPSIDIDFSSTSINLKFNQDVRVTRGNSSSFLNLFELKYSTNFFQLYNLSNEFVQEQSKDPSTQPIGAISNLAYSKKLNFDITYLQENVIVYSIFDNNSPKLFYRFATKMESVLG